MKYLIMIHSNPASRDTFTESSELIVSAGLADPSLAKRVSVREGRTIASDGPFAEVKEHLAVFYLVECESIERAVEVRPVLDLKSLDL